MITSVQNPKVKLIRALMTQGKARRREGKIVLEGLRIIRDALAQGYIPDFILYTPDFPRENLPELYSETFPHDMLEEAIFNELSATEHSQGVIGVFPLPRENFIGKSNLLLALDGIRDPGNLGTLFRTAVAAGVGCLILLPGTVDPYNPKVLRAGMGAHFRIPITTMDYARFANQYEGWEIFAADASDPESIPYTRPLLWMHKSILILGSEADGLSEPARQIAHQSVYIPMQNGVESLNSAVAGAVILFEIQRQRTIRPEE